VAVYTPYRQLKAEGVECAVIAPSMIPVKPGDGEDQPARCNKVARLDTFWRVTEVNVPEEGDERCATWCEAEGPRWKHNTHQTADQGAALAPRTTYTGTVRRWSWQYRIRLKTIKFELRLRTLYYRNGSWPF